MEPNLRNFTPLADHFFHSTKRNRVQGNFFVLNGGSFLIALALLTSVYITQINHKSNTLNTNAATKYSCPPDVPNPTGISATTIIDNKLIDVKSDTTITSTNITVHWEPVADAQHYYIVLSGDKGVPRPNTDPIAAGKKTDKTSYTFLDLQPGDYYVYVRTVSNKKDKYGYAAGVVFPTPGVCTVFYAANPSLHFTVKQP